ncbi:MAG: O-antigen ligase family protein [Planctomycetaceae bacterium]|nr:O-antigen ligase family protein [Planctomycetaceae bacterium]
MKGLIFTYLLTAAGVGGSVFSPFYGFLAYVALALLKPDAMWAHSIQGGRFSLIVAVAMLLSWGLRGFGNWNLGSARRIVFLFVGFWMWCVFLALNAESPPHAWQYVETMAKILLPFLVGITSCRDVKDLKALAWVIVICEGYVCFELNMHYFGGYNYLWHIGFGGVDNNSAAIGFVTALGVAFFLFLNTKPLWQKAIIGGCMLFILHAIQFSFSRGAMLATCIGVMISFVLIKKKVGHYALFLSALFAGLYLVGPEVRDRFMRTFETNRRGLHEASAQSRLDLWKNCFELLWENPIFGIGPDHWPLHAESFGWEPFKEAHSLWVQTATETGIPGILMYAGFYVTCILRCLFLIRKIPEDADPWFADSCRMSVASLVGFGVSAQFVSLEALEVPYYVCLLGAGGLLIYSRSQQTSPSADASGTPAPADWRDTVEPEVVEEFTAPPVLIYN